jgi:putative beta barrel porin BBP7
MRGTQIDRPVWTFWQASIFRTIVILVITGFVWEAAGGAEYITGPPKPISEAEPPEVLSNGEASQPDQQATQTQYTETEDVAPILVESPGNFEDGEVYFDESQPIEAGLSCPCGSSHCSVAMPCESCPPSRIWARAEYLLWWTNGFSTPPLVTTSVDGTARAVAGVLGEPGTSILAGGNSFAGDANSGWRITLGVLPDCDQMVGFQLGYYGFGHSATRASFDHTDYSILARPFYNIERGSEGQDAELIAFPAFVEGQIDVAGTTTIQGVEVLMRSALHQGCANRIDVLAGWRFNRLDDELLITDTKTVLDAGFGLAVGTVLDEFDQFETKNTFNGVELGVVMSKQHCRWTFEALLKLALGNNRSTVTIDGQTIVTVPVPGGAPDVAVTPAGLLAQETNIGEYRRDVFAMLPELGVTVGYSLTPRLRATVGYSFLYFSNVVRPGEAIDTELNLSQLDGALVGAPHPLFTWQSTDAWAQGVNFGLDYRF